MTREENIEMLNILLDNAKIGCADITVIKHVSFDSFKFVLEQTIKTLSQEPCSDAISREDVIHYLECHKDEIHSDVLTFVKHLPSVSTTKNIVNHGTMNITL
jgi:hypothetical protein